MKTHVLAAVILGALSLNSYAMPAADNPQATQAAVQPQSIKKLHIDGANLLAEGGSDRLIEQRKKHLKETQSGSANSSLQQQSKEIAEGGSDRLIERRQQRLDVAEGGADRLIERQKSRSA